MASTDKGNWSCKKRGHGSFALISFLLSNTNKKSSYSKHNGCLERLIRTIQNFCCFHRSIYYFIYIYFYSKTVHGFNTCFTFVKLLFFKTTRSWCEWGASLLQQQDLFIFDWSAGVWDLVYCCHCSPGCGHETPPPCLRASPHLMNRLSLALYWRSYSHLLSWSKD